MKRNLAAMLALAAILLRLAAWGESARPAQGLPTPYPEARYGQMSAKSPFAVASATSVATAAPTPGFAAQLYVDALASVGPTYYVAIKSRDPDQQAVLFLAVGGTSSDGMKVDAVHWSDETAKSTVDVTKGGEKATLSFDEAQLAKNDAPAGAPAPGQPVRLPILPGQGRVAGFPVNAPFNQPGAQFNRNRVFPPQQGQIPPGFEGGPGMPGYPAMQNGLQVRRRIRTIQAGQ